MEKITTENLVIGGGPAGYPAAIRLGQLGQAVALVEKSSLGGTCLNVGCIPSKALINVATRYKSLSSSLPEVGIAAKAAKIDWSKTISWKDKLVTKTTAGVGSLLKANKVLKLSGHCRITGQNSALIDDKQAVEFKNLVIATGSVISELADFKFDHQQVLNSTDMLALKKIPQSMILIGGGVIGMELGMLYASLDCEVTIVEVAEKILPAYEDAAVNLVKQSFTKLGGKILTSTTPISLKKAPQQNYISLKIKQNDKETVLKAEKLAIAAGRKPNLLNLGLETLGLEMAGDRIKVDDQMRTSLKHIYAVGDVAPGVFLAHKATAEGILAAEAIAGHKVSRADIKVIPDVVYTKPEIAQVGYSEKKAAEAGIATVCGKFPFSALGIAAAVLEETGYVKYVATASEHKIIGATIVANRAADMISEATVAIEMGASLEDVALSIHPHPSFGEAHMEAAASGLKSAIHVINR